MHKAIKSVVSDNDYNMYFLLIDGNDFKPYLNFTEKNGYEQISHTCIEGGDNKYASIAAASILAKDIIGKTGCQIVTVRNSVVQMLSGSLYSPNIFPDYQVLSPASQFKNRHESILLTLNATVEAIETIIITTKYQSR